MASVWLRTGFPIWAFPQFTHDDMLFIREAAYLGSGSWLGPFDTLTLAKGMFYPLFILVTSQLAIPLNIAEQIAYLAASMLMARFVGRVSRQQWLGAVLFAVLAFNPTLWSGFMLRVLREALYVSLSLGVVALLLFVAFPESDTGSPWRQRWAKGAGLGLCFGAFWLTREEGLWLVPAMVAVTVVSLLAASRRNRDGRRGSVSLWRRRVGLPLVLAAVVFSACIGGVAAMNMAKYGVFITNEFKSGPFVRAYGALARIEQDKWQPYVVISEDARQHAYAASPAARELAPYLDGPAGAEWKRNGCAQLGWGDCTEILAPWFIWAFRDAVAHAGHYRSASEAMRFYDRLADEIDAACRDGRLPCGPNRTTLMPVFQWRYLAESAFDAPIILQRLMRMGYPEIESRFSVGFPTALQQFSHWVGGIAPPARRVSRISGWVASPLGKPSFGIRLRIAVAADLTISEAAAPDVERVYPTWSAVRFEIETTCPIAACDLSFSAPGKPERSLPLKELHAGPVVKSDELNVTIDSVLVSDSTAAETRGDGAQVSVARAIGWVYATAVPVLSVVAAIGFAVAWTKRRSLPIPRPLVALAVACAAAVAARVALLTYLDVTSLPSNSTLYVSPASPFVIVWIVLGCWALARTLRARPIDDRASE